MSEFMVQLIAQYPEIARAQELAGVLPPIVGSILETIESKGKASERQIEIVVKIVRKFEANMAEAEEAELAGYFGQVGEAASAVVEIVQTKNMGYATPPGWRSTWQYRRASYGYKERVMLKMKTGAGHMLVTFSTAEFAYELAKMVGEKAAVKFKVKAHEVYKGVKQTVVSHIKADTPDEVFK